MKHKEYNNIKEMGIYIKASENDKSDIGKLFRLCTGDILECECDSRVDMWGDWDIDNGESYPIPLTAYEIFELYDNYDNYFCEADVRNKLTPLANILAMYDGGMLFTSINKKHLDFLMDASRLTINHFRIWRQ